MRATLRAVRTVRLQPALDRGRPATEPPAVHVEPQVASYRAEATDNVLRWVPAVAIGAILYITLLELWRIVAFPALLGHTIGVALIAAAFALPLHLRHVWFALQGRRPPAGAWTMSALALVNVIEVALVGAGWLFQLASLAVSLLIVARGKWAALACAAVALPALAVAVAPELIPSTVTAQINATYLFFALSWRTVMQYVPVRLVGVLRQLKSARADLEARAVVRERLRIDQELRDGLGVPLGQLVMGGEAAARVAVRDRLEAIEYLRKLVSDARATLAEVRRIVARYQATSLRSDIRAAAALLEATGARVEVVVAERLPLDAADVAARRSLHGALAGALRGGGAPLYVLSISRNENGKPRITLTAHELTGEQWEAKQ